MNTDTRQINLACFGALVLETLEKHKQWDADTLDEIASDAATLGLAGLSEQHEFVRLDR